MTTSSYIIVYLIFSWYQAVVNESCDAVFKNHVIVDFVCVPNNKCSQVNAQRCNEKWISTSGFQETQRFLESALKQNGRFYFLCVLCWWYKAQESSWSAGNGKTIWQSNIWLIFDLDAEVGFDQNNLLSSLCGFKSNKMEE